MPGDVPSARRLRRWTPRATSRLERRVAATAFLVLTLSVAAHRLWPSVDEPLVVTLTTFGDDGDGTDRILPIDPWGRLAVPYPQRGQAPAERHLRAASLSRVVSQELDRLGFKADADRCQQAINGHLHAALDLGADPAAIASAVAPRQGRSAFWIELGGWPEYSLGPDGKDQLGWGDDVALLRGQVRLALYLALPSAGASVALLLCASLLAARLLPLAPRSELELLAAAPLAAFALGVASLARWVLPLDPLGEMWGERPDAPFLLGRWATLLALPRGTLFGSAGVALWVLITILRLRARPHPPSPSPKLTGPAEAPRP